MPTVVVAVLPDVPVWLAALVKGADAGSIDGLMCPVGGADVMGKVADLLGMAVANTEPKVAVVRCNGYLRESSSHCRV